MKVAKSVYMEVDFWEWVDKSKTKEGSKNNVIKDVIMEGLKVVNPALYKKLNNKGNNE